MKKNEKTSGKFARRLAWRVLLWVSLFSIGVIALVLILVFAGTAVQSKQQTQSIMDIIGGKVETMLAVVETSAKNNVDEIEWCLNNSQDLYEGLESELRLNPHYIGCGLCMIPDYFPDKGRWFEPYVVYRDSTNIELMQLGSASHDYFKREWYIKGLESEGGYWSEPYFDFEGAKAMLCTYALPVHDSQGKTVGVFGADLPLDWLNNLVREQEKEQELRVFSYNPEDPDEEKAFFCFVIDRNGKYIVNPEAKHMQGGDFKEYVESTPDTLDNYVLQQMLEGEKGWWKHIKINDETYYIDYAPIKNTDWSVAVVQHWSGVYIWGIAISILIVMISLIGGLLIFFSTRYSIWHATKPLQYLNESAVEVAKGHFDTKLPVFKHRDEISQLRDSFEKMQVSLSNYIEELKTTTASKATIEGELHIAHSIQMAMLPKTFPPFPERSDIDIYGSLTSAKAVGGDLYDFFIRDEKLIFCIGDVSGKGVPASLVMAVTRSLFRNIASHTAKPDSIVSALNDSLSEGNDTFMFVTLFVGVLDLPTGRFRYCNAGHDAPIIINKEEQYLLPVLPNLPVGAMSDYKYTAQECLITPETIIFLYTDGLTEAEDSAHNQFGMERIKDNLNSIFIEQKSSEVRPQQLINGMTDAVHQFVGDTEQSDDLTMLSVMYTFKQNDVRLERSLILSNDVQEVPKLNAFMDEICESLGFDISTTMKMNLAMEEAVVNVMNYAYPKGEHGEVRIKAEANDVRLKFVIRDDGFPYDPTEREEPDITLSAEERSIGGLGIHLVRQFMDSINYERVGRENIFTLRKKLK